MSSVGKAQGRILKTVVIKLEPEGYLKKKKKALLIKKEKKKSYLMTGHLLA